MLTESGNKRSAGDAGLPSGGRSFADVSGKSVRQQVAALVSCGKLREGELDDRVLGQVEGLPPSGIVHLLGQLAVALETKDIQNKSAYLSSMLRATIASSGLPPEVVSRLQQLYRSNVLKGQELDAKCMAQLTSMGPAAAAQCLDIFLNKNLVDVRNASALFMSTVRAMDGNQARFNAPYSTGQGSAQAPRSNDREFRGAVNVGYRDRYDNGARDNSSPYAAIGSSQSMPEPPLQPQLQQGSRFTPQGLQFVTDPPVYGLPPPVQVVVPPPLFGTNGPMVPASADRGVPRRNYGAQQAAVGVRVNEFHALANCATAVHPSAALQLQTLWDAGNKLVSMLDDGSWAALATLSATESLAVIEDVAEKMASRDPPRNVNAVFMSLAKRFIRDPGSSMPITSAVGNGGSIPSYRSGYNRESSSQYSVSGSGHSSYDRTPAALSQSYGGHGGGNAGGGVSGGGGRGDFGGRDQRSAPGGVSAAGGLGIGSVDGSPLQLLDPLLRQKVQELIHSGGFNESAFDEPVCERLRLLPEGQGLDVMRELATHNLSMVRNPPAYIMGIIKRVRDGNLR